MIPDKLSLNIDPLSEQPLLPSTEENRAIYNQMTMMLQKQSEIISALLRVSEAQDNLIDTATDHESRIAALE